MGQKVNPIGFRIGITKNWSSRWFNEKEYGKCILEDIELDRIIKDNFKDAGISKIIIERRIDRVRIIINAVRPAYIIGRGGKEVERLKTLIEKHFHKKYYIDIREIDTPELDAQIVADNIAELLKKRVNYKNAMKRAISYAMTKGAKGIKIQCSGRLAGAEMKRRAWRKEGKIPLSTLRANIDYGFSASLTTYGYIGVKVWIYKGEVKTNELI